MQTVFVPDMYHFVGTFMCFSLKIGKLVTPDLGDVHVNFVFFASFLLRVWSLYVCTANTTLLKCAQF